MVDGEGGVVLLEDAVVDEADLGGQGHGLHLVVGDVDEGGAGLHVEALELVAHLQAQLGVQVGEGLVHEEDGGLGGQGAGDGHTLLLAAGELGGVAVHEHADLHDAGDPADGEVDLLLGHLADLGDHLAVLDHLELVVEALGLPGGLRLGLEGADLAGQVLARLQVVAEELLGGEHGDGEGVDELDAGLVLVQLAVFVPALLQDLHHLFGPAEDLGQAGGVLGLKVHFGHGLLDVAQAEGDVVVDRHIGPQGVVLEEEAHLPLVGGDVDPLLAVEDHGVADGDAAAGGGLQAGDHPQGGGLAAAGGAQQGDEGVVLDDHAQVVYGVEFAPALGHMF